MNRFITLLVVSLILPACSLNTDTNIGVSLNVGSVTNNIETQSLDGFDCVFISIYGPGIVSNVPDNYFAPDDVCLKPGLISAVQPISAAATNNFFNMSLVAGSDRVIKVYVMRTYFTSTWWVNNGKCAFPDLKPYFPSSGSPAYSRPEIYEVASTDKLNLFQNTHIDILASYDASKATINFATPCTTIAR